jgi:hypothetical protein
MVMNSALDAQINDLKTHAKTQLEQHLACILEPTEQTRNPYNPVDHAIKNIKLKIMDMVQNAIQVID